MPKPPRPKMITLGFKISEYNPQALQRHSLRELKREYSRLRSAANKRLDRLMESEYADTQVVAYNAGKFIPIKAIQSESELRHLLVDAARFLTSEQGSLTGQKELTERLIRTWRDDKGFAFINQSNVRDWVKFLDYVNNVEGHVYELASMSEAFEEMDLAKQLGMIDRVNVRDVYEYYREKTSR